MSIAVAFISDRGPDKYLPDCVGSFYTYAPAVDHVTVIDDSAHLLGMRGAARAAWDWALDTGADYLFHVEEDFRFTEPIPLAGMQFVLRYCPHLAQVVLKRQPWSAEEKQFGGQIEYSESLGNIYIERVGPTSVDWVEHSTLFSMNPSLIPRRTLELGWPDTGGGVERDITTACEHACLRFAYYGKKADPPRCEHVGHERAGSGWRW